MKNKYKIITLQGNLILKNEWNSLEEAEDYMKQVADGFRFTTERMYNEKMLSTEWEENGDKYYCFNCSRISYVFKITKRSR